MCGTIYIWTPDPPEQEYEDRGETLTTNDILIIIKEVEKNESNIGI
jgi:hypothetical protein